MLEKVCLSSFLYEMEESRMSVQDTAINIIDTVGLENIDSITHCATRIRIVPKNAKNIGKLEETESILGSLYANNQFQVFVQLSEIEEVYLAIKNQLNA